MHPHGTQAAERLSQRGTLHHFDVRDIDTETVQARMSLERQVGSTSLYTCITWQ